MAAWVQRAWGVPAERTTCIPNPFVPSPKLLQIPIESETNIVTYVGRLELRKGVVDLAEAIPKVLRRFPSTIFRFVGRPLSSPRPRMQMDEYLRDRLARFLGSVRIEGPVDPEEIAGVLANTDVCVFPSRFESFGMAAVEGMAAGRGVVCTAGTGLEEVVAGGRCGLLVPPRNPAELAKAICYLLEHPAERMVLGRVAREHVLNAFSWESVGTVQEASYHRAIDRRRGRPLSASAARRAGRAAADVAGLPA
jgi:glycosyltransferase involved in cell wall biosynthesis